MQFEFTAKTCNCSGPSDDARECCFRTWHPHIKGPVYMEKIGSANRGYFVVRLFSICLYMREIAAVCRG